MRQSVAVDWKPNDSRMPCSYAELPHGGQTIFCSHEVLRIEAKEWHIIAVVNRRISSALRIFKALDEDCIEQVVP